MSSQIEGHIPHFQALVTVPIESSLDFVSSIKELPFDSVVAHVTKSEKHEFFVVTINEIHVSNFVSKIQSLGLRFKELRSGVKKSEPICL